MIELRWQSVSTSDFNWRPAIVVYSESRVLVLQYREGESDWDWKDVPIVQKDDL